MNGAHTQKQQQLTYLRGMAAGYVTSPERKEALLMLIGGARKIDVARALSMGYSNVDSLWRKFITKVKKDQEGISDEDGKKGKEGAAGDNGEEEGDEDGPIQDTDDSDEEEQARKDDKW